MRSESRRHRRLGTAIPVRFNLNSQHHLVPHIRKTGVGGTIKDISLEGLGIDCQMDLLDVCQIFPEALDGDSVFGLELVFTDSTRSEKRIRGEVIWYHVGELEKDLRPFQAGLHLKDAESLAVLGTLVQSMSQAAKPLEEYEGFLDLREFRLAESEIRGSVKNMGDKTVGHLVIEAKYLDSRGKEIHKKRYRAVPYGRDRKKLKPRTVIRVAAEDREIPPSAANVEVSVHKLILDRSVQT